MSDILTQLQTSIDQLLTQFYSTHSYLSQRHPLIPPDAVPGDPYTNPPQPAPTTNTASSVPISTANPPQAQQAPDESGNLLKPGPEDTSPSMTTHPLIPDHPETFAGAQNDLAEDLVWKGQQILSLIGRLPGSGRSEGVQEERIRELVEEVSRMEEERKRSRKAVRKMVEMLDGVVMGMATSIPTEAYGASRKNGHG